METTILAASAALALVSYILGLVTRQYLPAYMTEKGTNLATKEDVGEITKIVEAVKTENAAALAQLKGALDRTLHVHKAQFDVELKSYKAIWAAVVNVRSAVLQLRPIMDFKPSEPTARKEEEQRRVAEYGRARDAFMSAVLKWQPFYADDVYSTLETARNIIEMEFFDFQDTERNKGEYWKEQRQNADTIVTSCKAIMRAIRDRLRSLTVPSE